MSVGLEDPADIIGDLDQALNGQLVSFRFPVLEKLLGDLLQVLGDVFD